MSLVWRKIKRSNQEAFKYEFSTTFQELMLEAGAKWQPNKIALAWVRRRSGGRATRRVETRSHKWEPGLTDPFRGFVVWPHVSPECLQIETTLYKDKRTQLFDSKEWVLQVEEVLGPGKRRILATAPLNLRLFIDEMPGTQIELKLKLKPAFKFAQSCVVQMLITCTLLKHGEGVEDDLQSLSSELSMRGQTFLSEREGRESSVMSDVAPDAGMASGESFDTTPKETQEELHKLVDEIKSWPSPDEEPPEAFSPPLPKSPPKPSRKTPSPARPTNTSDSLPTRPSFPPPHEGTSMGISRTDQPERAFRYQSKRKSITPPPSPVLPRRSLGKQPVRDIPEEQKPVSMPDADPTSLADVKPVNDRSASSNAEAAASATAAAANVAPTQQEMLAWCQAVTKDYSDIEITDFDKSWRNGIAVGAIIHHFRPDLIDFEALRPRSIEQNWKRIFEAAEDKLGVPRSIDISDMRFSEIPDRISIIAFLYHLKMKLTGQKPVTDPVAEGPRRPPSRTVEDFEAEVADEFEQLRIGRMHEEAIYFWGSQDDLASVGDVLKCRPSPGVGSIGTELGDGPGRMNRELSSGGGLPSFESQFHAASSHRRSAESAGGGGRKSKSPAADSRFGKPKKHRKSSDNNRSNRSSRSRSSSSGGADAVSNKQSAAGPDRLSLTLSVEDVQKPVLMTRQQLRNPFDSDEDSSPMSPPLGLLDSPVGSSDPGVKSRAKAILEQFTAEHQEKGGVPPAPGPLDSGAEDERQRQLRARARQLIAEANRSVGGQGTIRISETLPEGFGGSPRLVGATAGPDSEPSTRVTSPLNERVAALRDAGFDRVRRFGSMRATELQDFIRTYSVPKDLSSAKGGVPNGNSAGDDPDGSRMEKCPTPPPPEDIASELDKIGDQLAALDFKAKEVERKWRNALGEPALPDREEQMASEFLTLLNERNLLMRREYRLQLMQKSQQLEAQFKDVHEKLGVLMQMDERLKTEFEKQRIDQLMNELVDLVNQRDDIAHKLINEEHELELDQETGTQAINRVVGHHGGATGRLASQLSSGEVLDPDKNCVIM